MSNNKRYTILGSVLVLIVLAIWLLGGFEGRMPVINLGLGEVDKESKYDPAVEFARPYAFMNSEPFELADHIGDKVILIDFWTYSCINCQRTQPYLNAWQEKYGDEGLLIVGVHTPEFEFERDPDNVLAAVRDAGITYPVMLDNERATWKAYENRYWPRKYLIDIDGYIVYDHIGEGNYAETEQKIQELLNERRQKLGLSDPVPTGIVNPNAEVASVVRSPETYFGAWRNNNFANGAPGTQTEKTYTVPEALEPNAFYLDGTWKIEREYAVNTERDASVSFFYSAQKVFMVAHSEEGARVEVYLDGELVTDENAGSDVNGEGIVEVTTEKLYRLIESSVSGEHVLEIRVIEGELDLYTYTFG